MGEEINNKTEEVSSTESHLDTLLEDINETELKAMEMKLLGIKYESIANELNLKKDEVKYLFRSSGKLCVIYHKYKEQRIKELRQDATDLSKAHVKTAVECLIGVMAQKDKHSPRVSAAKEILDRVLGRVPNVNVNFPQEGYDEAAEIFKDVINKMK